MINWARPAVKAAALLAAVAPVAAGQAAPAPAPGRPVAAAVYVRVPIPLDPALPDSIWGVAAPITEFRQQEPREGAVPSERTAVRVLYDDRALYVGIRAFDAEPRRVNARELTRDANFGNDDKVEVLLDTYRDGRTAFRFAVNPLGTQQDALVTDDGRTVNLTWDGAWESAGRVDSLGWAVVLRIPFTTLRYAAGQDAWGLNVARVIRRKNEEMLWSSWQRQFGLEMVSQAGTVTGMAGVRTRRLVEVKPYGSSVWNDGIPAPGGTGFRDPLSASAGIEVARVGITPSLTGELTVNPDFGQAEVDQQVINLTRFSVFFPERRDFFLENIGVFQFGQEGVNQLFYTRRIGLTEEGQQLPLDFGVKLTGKQGGWALGALGVQSRRLEAPNGAVLAPTQDYLAVRVRRDVLRRSNVGAMFVAREGGTTTAWHRGAGVDAELYPNNFWQVRGFLMATANAGVPGTDRASWRLSTRYETNEFRVIALVEDIGTNFDPQLGFAFRTGVRQYFGQAAVKPRPRFLPWIREWQFEAQYERYDNRDGSLQTQQTELSLYNRYQNSADFTFRPLEHVIDVPPEDFTINGVVVPAGRYEFNRPRVSLTTNRSRRVVATARVKWGGYYGGTREEVSGSISVRPDAHLLVEASQSWNHVKLPGGEFTTNLFSGRLTYNASRAVLGTVVAQFNSAAELASVNARLRWIFRPYSDFFLIYNQTTGAGVERPGYQLQAKLTYDIRL